MGDYMGTRRMYPVLYRGKQARAPRLLVNTELGVAGRSRAFEPSRTLSSVTGPEFQGPTPGLSWHWVPGLQIVRRPSRYYSLAD